MAIGPCPSCGAVFPARIGRCPSCRAWMGPGPGAVGFAALILVMIAASAFFVQRRLGWPGSPRATVQVTSNGFVLAPGGKGTDASATIDNTHPAPVDVTVRVRGYDIGGNLVAEETLGPYRNLAPGRRRDIAAHLPATPLDAVTFEVAAVEPNRP